MEERLKYIHGAFKDWLITLMHKNTANLYLLYDASEIVNDEHFKIEIHNVYWRENSPLKKTQGYLILKDKNENETVAREWLSFFNQVVQSGNYTIHGLVNFVILTNLIGSLPDAIHYELTNAVIELIPVEKSKLVLSSLINLFNKDYKFSHDSIATSQYTTSDWVKLFRTTQYLDRFNNPVHILIEFFKNLATPIEVLNYLSKLDSNPRAALIQYGIEFINPTGKEMIHFLRDNTNEVTFYSAIIVDRPQQKPVFFNEEFAELIIHQYWKVSGSYFFQLIYNSTNKLYIDVEAMMKVEITKLLRHEIYINQVNYNLLDQFVWPEDYLALGGWLHQQTLKTRDDQEITLHFFDFLANELASQFKNMKNAIPEILSTYNSYSKEKWFGDPFKLNSQYIQVYLNWALMNANEDNWHNLKKYYNILCQEIKVLLYGSYFGKHYGLKLGNQLLMLILHFPIIQPEKIIGINRLQELHSIFIKHIGLQWVFFSEQNRLIWNHKDHQPGFMDTELMFIINILKSCPPQYKLVVNPLLQLIRENQMTEWPVPL